MPVSDFLDYANWVGKAHPNCGWHCCVVWSLGMEIKENVGLVWVSISLCFLTMDGVWAAASASYLPDFSTMKDWPSNGQSECILPSSSSSVREFVWATCKVTNTIFMLFVLFARLWDWIFFLFNIFLSPGIRFSVSWSVLLLPSSYLISLFYPILVTHWYQGC